MYVALLGLDGCGKSSILEKLKSDEKFNNYDFIWSRWKPKMLKPLYKIFAKKTITSNQTDDKKEKIYKKNFGLKKKIFKSNLIKKFWLKLAICDYKGTFKKNTKNALKENKSIVFDRYFYDLFIDQCINLKYDNETILYYINKYSKKFLSLDKVIFISVSPEICFSRKNDIPCMEYLEIRNEIYNYLAEQLNWIVISGEQDINDEYEEIVNNILGEIK